MKPTRVGIARFPHIIMTRETLLDRRARVKVECALIMGHMQIGHIRSVIGPIRTVKDK
jgi:hypothetical protein